MTTATPTLDPTAEPLLDEPDRRVCEIPQPAGQFIESCSRLATWTLTGVCTTPYGRERLNSPAARPVPGPDRPLGLAIPPLALAVHALGIAAGSGPAQRLTT